MLSAGFVLLSLLATAFGQQAGTSTAETHPSLQWSQCTASGCVVQTGSIVLDANWRWLHNVGGYTNCYTGNEWSSTYCPDPVSCAQNCALDGADYSGTYGITTSGNALTLAFKTGSNVGSRVYLMASETEYEMFNLLNKEFTMDVELSSLPCGLNGAVYFSQMDADGGASKYPNNKAGAKYGTGYCDSQCPHDIKFIDGEANISGWNTTSANSGTGAWGTCCSEMDIWEANSISAAVTPHPCSVGGQTECGGSSGVDCSTACDQAGCDFNSYRMGNLTFYGPHETIDTTQKITVVTQFLTTDGTDTGDLSEIRRFYVQNNVVIPNSQSTIAGVTGNSITDSFCDAQKTAFGDTNYFEQQGGMKQMGAAFKAGMVLVLSIWDDYAVDMLWLDSDYPTTADPTKPGVARGTCATTSGAPADVESSAANAKVTYSNIKVGTIGSTFPSNGTSTTTTSSSSSTSKTSTSTSKTTTSTSKTSTSTTKTTSTTTTTSTGGQPTQTHWGQCGGNGWTGPTVCASGTTCTPVSPPWYSQCL